MKNIQLGHDDNLRVRLMVSGEERARPHSAEDQARLVFTDLRMTMMTMMIMITMEQNGKIKTMNIR